MPWPGMAWEVMLQDRKLHLLDHREPPHPKREGTVRGDKGMCLGSWLVPLAVSLGTHSGQGGTWALAWCAAWRADGGRQVGSTRASIRLEDSVCLLGPSHFCTPVSCSPPEEALALVSSHQASSRKPCLQTHTEFLLGVWAPM